jgi:hypothetical protein
MMLRKLWLFVLLLPYTDVLADGPLFSIWHIDGHGYAWQQAQIDAGLPLEFSLRMPQYARSSGAAYMADLNGNAALIATQRSVALRMNNIPPEVTSTVPPPAVTEDNWRECYTCVVRRADGTLRVTLLPCPLGPTDPWAEVGRKWATSVWMTRLQEILPTVDSFVLRENNEGNRVVFNDLRTRVKVNGVITWPWKSRAELEAIDLRIAEWVEERRDRDSTSCMPEFTVADNAHYHALYAGMDAAMVPGWQGKLRTVGYGGFVENRQNDTASVQMYLGYFKDGSLTDSDYMRDYNAAAAEWPAAGWREWSIRPCGTGPRFIYEGAQLGLTAAMDPTSFGGWNAWLAWASHQPGIDFRAVEWHSAQTTPRQLIFASTGTSTIQQVHVDSLAAIGRSDLLTATVEDYERAVLCQFQRVHTHPVLNRYWREGETVLLLTSPLNTSTVNRVYATETTIPGISQTLLTVYTPCDLSGEIQVGGWTVPAKRFAYYLTGAVLEIE